MKLNSKEALFSVLLISNLYSIIYTIVTKDLLGEIDIKATSYSVALFGFFFCLTYFLFQFPIYKFTRIISRSKSSLLDLPPTKLVNLNKNLGVTLIILQLVYIFFIFKYNAGVVGSTETAIPGSYFWAFIQLDFLMMYYIAAIKKSPLYFFNVILFSISNVFRGWTGWLLFLIFIYLTRKGYSIRITARILFLFFLLVFIIFPLILLVKYYTRAGMPNISLEEIVSITSGADNIFDYVIYSLSYLANRLQQFTLTYSVYFISDFLTSEYQKGQIVSFWLEHLYGNFILKFIGIDPSRNLGVVAAENIPFNYTNIDVFFNISPGLLGWFFVGNPFQFSLYALLVCLISHALIQKISKSKDLDALLWFQWLVLLFPGWLNQFINFIHAGFIFILATIVLRKLNLSFRQPTFPNKFDSFK